MTVSDNISASCFRFHNKYIVLKLKPGSDYYKSKGMMVIVGRLAKIDFAPNPDQRSEEVITNVTIRDIEGQHYIVQCQDIEKIIRFK